jgi:hypothetical protein
MVLDSSQYMTLVQYSIHRWCWLHHSTCHWFNIPPTDGAGFFTVHDIGSIFHPQMVLAPSQYMPLVQYSTHRWCLIRHNTCNWFNIPPTNDAGSVTVHAICSIFHPQIVLAPSQYMYMTVVQYFTRRWCWLHHSNAIGPILHPQMVLAPSQYVPLVQYYTHRWCWLHHSMCHWFNIPPTDGSGSITVHDSCPIFHTKIAQASSQYMPFVQYSTHRWCWLWQVFFQMVQASSQ